MLAAFPPQSTPARCTRLALGLVREGAFHHELVGGQNELAHPIRSGRSEFCVRFLPSPDDHGLMVVLPRTRLHRACYRVTICRESDGQGLTRVSCLRNFGGEQVSFAVKPAVSFKRKTVVPIPFVPELFLARFLWLVSRDPPDFLRWRAVRFLQATARVSGRARTTSPAS